MSKINTSKHHKARSNLNIANFKHRNNQPPSRNSKLVDKHQVIQNTANNIYRSVHLDNTSKILNKQDQAKKPVFQQPAVMPIDVVDDMKSIHSSENDSGIKYSIKLI